MFSKVLGVVLSFLGISAFAKDENGKSILLDVQREQLKQKYGELFLQSFEKELQEFEKDGASAESAVTPEVVASLKADRDEYARLLAESRARLKKLEEEKVQFEAAIKEKDAQIEKMGKTKEPADGQAVQAQNGGKMPKFKPDMSLMHNQYLEAAFRGAAYSGNETIDTTELQQEFGKYVAAERLQIMMDLLGKTESIQYMSTIVTDKTEVRAVQSDIDSVLQAFVPKWTPKGKSTFTPLVIKNYKCKINVSITPSDIMEDILGYLYDEQLIIPKLDEEREIALAVGEYKENTATNDGDPAGAANESMDGYVTQLKALKEASNDKVTWLLDGETLSDETLLAQIDKAVDQVKPLYKKKTMFIHADPDIVTRYSKAYREKYPWTKNEDGEKVKVDFSRFTFAPLEGMRGTGVFFITPKENFKHLKSKNPQNTKIRMETYHYDVHVMAEWWEGTGFWLAEAIFAYIPPAEEAESSQGGGV